MENFDKIIENEKEWRVHILSEIKGLRVTTSEIKREMITLKVKVAVFSSLIGSIATWIGNKLL